MILKKREKLRPYHDLHNQTISDKIVKMDVWLFYTNKKRKYGFRSAAAKMGKTLFASRIKPVK